MARLSKRAPACKISRAVELIQGMAFGGTFATLRLCVGKDEATYTVEPRKVPRGQAARYVKQGLVDVYEDGSGHHDVLLDGELTTCDCKGFQRWGRCRHCWSLEIALRRGWLR
jgi:hypothetical protein